MSWSRKPSCRVDEVREGVRETRHQQYEVHQQAGLGSGFGLLPWLLMGMGAFSNLFQGETPNPWIGGLGLLTFNSLYVYVAFRAFRKETREAASTRVALVLMGLVTCGLAMGYGGNWLLFFPLLGLATGAVVRLPHLRWAGAVVTVVAGAAAVLRDGWGGLDTAYATWISTMVTAAIMSLSEAVRQLRRAREELARRAVEEERLRFSRDLHDLLGHTLSVIVVKSEAARRLAPRDLDAALGQVRDIESVGRQALTEIREAVTGYREGSLSADLDRAASALRAAGIEPVVHRSGPPPTARTETLLGWVVREAVTNTIRHSGARHCEISVRASAERTTLRVWDDGGGTVAGARPIGGDSGGTVTGAHPPGGDSRGTVAMAHLTADDSRGTAAGVHPPEGDGEGTAVGAPFPEADGTEPASALHKLHNPRLGGTGLIGLAERLAAAGGRLEAGPGARGGFVVRAELPTESGESVRADGPTETVDEPRISGTSR